MLTRSFTNVEQKRLAADVSDTFATHLGLVHDVIDTNCLAQNGRTYGRVYTTFKRRSIFSKEAKKSSEKLLC